MWSCLFVVMFVCGHVCMWLCLFVVMFVCGYVHDFQYTIKKIFYYSTTNTSIHGSKFTINILNMQQVLHHVHDVVVSGNTFDVPLNNFECIDGILA